MKLFAAITFLLALATASPVANITAREDHPLAKRDTEVIYLSNCRHLVSCCPAGSTTYLSRIFYYPASGQSQNGEAPAANDQCTVTSGSYVPWEQGSPQCTFPTSVSFTAHIDSDAQSRPLYSWSGWGTNGFKNFNCYRDNLRQLFTVSGPEWATICDSVYYCIPQ